MKQQNFKNHARYYPLHHFVITPLTLILFGWTMAKADFTTPQSTSESLYRLLIAIILLLLPILARLYALKIQNRMILNEMRIRYFHLTGNSFYEKENLLKLGQIIALRFASDEELLELIEKSIEKGLKPKEIKLQIKNWKGDYRRV
ncbi:MAG: DUF6526 family protein [Algoriphagus sp.]|jgi:hypothetical protein|nr:DUF6526 family protein [Algoriphagus sp.]